MYKWRFSLSATAAAWRTVVAGGRKGGFKPGVLGWRSGLTLLFSDCHPAGPEATIPEHRALPRPPGLLEMTPNRTQLGNDFLLMVKESVHGKEHPWTCTLFLQEHFSWLHLLFQAYAFSCTVLSRCCPYWVAKSQAADLTWTPQPPKFSGAPHISCCIWKKKSALLFWLII